MTDVWPREDDLLREADPAIEDRWTANLHPGLETLLEGHRALFRTLCGPPPGPSPLSPLERAIVERRTGPVARRLGYGPAH